MRITILTIGSFGDVQPFLALAVRLQIANHVVRLAVPPNYQKLVESHGVNFSPLGQDNRDLLQEAKVRSMIELGGRLPFINYRIREKQRLFDQINLQALQACWDAQLIIYRASEYLAAFSIAQKKAVPCVEIGMAPLVRTRAFPSLYFYGSPNLGGFYNWNTHIFAEQVIWQFFRHSTNNLRKKVLGLAPLPMTGPECIKREYGVSVLHPFSPSVVPKPIDWPEWAYITGYWIQEGLNNWRPSQSLVNFLESGPPPVYIGFGSMPSRNPQDTLNLVTNAIQATGQRAILATGWGGIKPPSSLTDQFFVLESAPHEWLFPRMSATVHHGGMGTTAASIRAGVPTIIVPHNYDQPFWGQTIAKLGIGPKPIPRKKLSAENLSLAINIAISDQSMGCKAEILAERVRAEDGLGCAIDIINKYTR
jgi:sterol 3beta-glucosyltransferase